LLTRSDGDLKTHKVSETPRHHLPYTFFGGYRTYCEADYEELARINSMLEDDKESKIIDENAILSLYQGKSVFTMVESMDLNSLLADCLSQCQFNVENKISCDEIEANLFKRLYQILMTNQTVINRKSRDEASVSADAGKPVTSKPFFGLFSALEMIPYSQDTGASGKLL
jgi:DNA-binding transcriptional MerR regulator